MTTPIIRCATCGADVAPPATNTAFPFCSTRCKLVDLGRWVDGEYAIDPATGKLDIIDPEEAEEVPDEH
jgi:endogenous inhibitor of DNA gyrase (YacG/DUF329 family)